MKRFALGEFGSQLWSREKAKEIRAKLIAVIESSSPGETIVVDLAGVEVFDYSFANELFGKTIHTRHSEWPDRLLVIENLTTYTRENLGKALESLGLATIERSGRKMQLLGKSHPVDAETFAEIVAEGGPTSATSLSKRLGIGLTAMNERLSKLVDLGLVLRAKATSTAGREQFMYSAPR